MEGRHIGKCVLVCLISANNFMNKQNPTRMTAEPQKVRNLKIQDGGRICTKMLRTQTRGLSFRYIGSIHFSGCAVLETTGVELPDGQRIDSQRSQCSAATLTGTKEFSDYVLV